MGEGLTGIESEPPAEDDERTHEAAEHSTAEAGREHADAQDEERLKVAPSQSVDSAGGGGGGLCRDARVQRVFQRVMDAFARRETEEEGNQARQEGYDQSLDLQQGEVTKDERPARQAQVELADVGRGGEPRGEIHLEVALEVEQDRDEDEQLADPDKDPPGLASRFALVSTDRKDLLLTG